MTGSRALVACALAVLSLAPAASAESQGADRAAAAIGSKCPLVDGKPCAGHGLCKLSEEDGKHKCFCEPGYFGESCNHASCVTHCSERGKCNLETKLCECDPGWSGLDCSVSICPNDCSGHGVCAQDGDDASMRACYCTPGWKGEACDTAVCPFNEHYVECSGHGRCSNGTCSCQYGFTGASCSIMVCNIPCVHGSCECDVNKLECTCTCDKGFLGPMCDRRCPRDCSGHGKCDEWGRCRCNARWTGVDCSQPGCPNDCSGHGTCNHNHTCTCEEGWHGVDCGKLKCPEMCNWRTHQGECLFDSCSCYPGFEGEACEIAKQEKEEGHPCGENCYEFCRANSPCEGSEEQVYVFQNGPAGPQEVAVPATSGPMVDAEIEAQTGKLQANTQARKCYLHCLQGCFSDCFAKVHTLSTEEREEAAAEIAAAVNNDSGASANVGMRNITGDISEAKRSRKTEGGISVEAIAEHLADQAREAEGTQ